MSLGKSILSTIHICIRWFCQESIYTDTSEWGKNPKRIMYFEVRHGICEVRRNDVMQKFFGAIFLFPFFYISNQVIVKKFFEYVIYRL